MKIGNFFTELKRRNVYKVAVAYAVVGWLLIQIATTTFPVLQIPTWAMRLVVVLVLLGFPIALVLAWAYEMTPEGIQRTHRGCAGFLGRGGGVDCSRPWPMAARCLAFPRAAVALGVA